MSNRLFEAIVSLLMAVMVVAMTATTTWLFKLDDRQFQLSSQVVTRQELRQELQVSKEDINRKLDKMDRRFDLIETLIRELVDKSSEK